MARRVDPTELGQLKLSLFYVNVVREDTNQQERFRIDRLLEGNKVPQDGKTITTSQYRWDALKKIMGELFNYDQDVHTLIVDRATFARYFPKRAHLATEAALTIQSQEGWEYLLKGIVAANIRHGYYSDIFLLIQAGDYPDDFSEEETQRRYDMVCGQSNYEVGEHDLTVPYESEAAEPNSYESFSPSPDIHFVTERRTSDVTESDLTEPWVPESPEPEAGPSAAVDDPKDIKNDKKGPLPIPLRLGGRSATRTGRSPARKRDTSQVSLIDDKEEYETENVEDEDYGLVDCTVVDNFVGNYNTGNNGKDWRETLDFFLLDFNTWLKGEELKNKTGDRKRVPMKKLPGMSVGLFDYQLVAVFNLLKFVLHDISGGFLCDEQGLGKTQEMFGLIALSYGLRKNKAEVRQAWRSGNLKGHNAKDSVDSRTCTVEKGIGFRCYCCHAPTRKLADLLPEGPSIIIAPTRGYGQILDEAKSKLDIKTLKVRIVDVTAAAKDSIFTPAEMKALAGKFTPSPSVERDEVTYSSQPNAGQGDWVIICNPAGLTKLVNSGSFSVDVTLASGAKKKKSGLLPGMVLMDEFHEYTAPTNNSIDSPTMAWLKRQKESRKIAPLVYFASGTPFGDSPADIRPAIDFFERPVWNKDEDHRMYTASLASFDDLIQTYHKRVEEQNNGEILKPEVIQDYRWALNKFLRGTMVRRLGTDQFQRRNLVDIGALKVKFTDHPLPAPLSQSLQDLADETRGMAEEELKLHPGKSMGILLRSEKGENILLKLRLASTFPGISAPLDEPFDFSMAETTSFINQAAEGDVQKTPYFHHIPTWARHSPKLDTITKTINNMLSDKTPIPGESTNVKKLILFSPIEAESMLLYGYLLLLKKKNSLIKPTWINSTMPQRKRQELIKAFLGMGNAPPNILVAPMSLAGTGLNLQKAKYSIVTSPGWTKRDNQQAYYRTHRHGQTQETQLSLLTAKWNPAERVILKKYEAKEVTGPDIWSVRADVASMDDGGLLDRHQSGATTPLSPPLTPE